MKPETNKKTMSAMNRIEGQVRGIAKMVEEDRYCIDIVTQIEAARAALARVQSDLLRQHLTHCVHQVLTSRDAAAREKITDELVKVFRR